MADYWLSFLEMVEILLMHYHAVYSKLKGISIISQAYASLDGSL